MHGTKVWHFTIAKFYLPTTSFLADLLCKEAANLSMFFCQKFLGINPPRFFTTKVLYHTVTKPLCSNCVSQILEEK